MTATLWDAIKTPVRGAHGGILGSLTPAQHWLYYPRDAAHWYRLLGRHNPSCDGQPDNPQPRLLRVAKATMCRRCTRCYRRGYGIPHGDCAARFAAAINDY